MASDLDTMSDTCLFIDARGEKSLVVLNAGFGCKSKANQDEKNRADEGYGESRHFMVPSYHRVDAVTTKFTHCCASYSPLAKED